MLRKNTYLKTIIYIQYVIDIYPAFYEKKSTVGPYQLQYFMASHLQDKGKGNIFRRYSKILLKEKYVLPR